MKQHLATSAYRPTMKVICGHCGEVHKSMTTLAKHLNQKGMHLEGSKIVGYNISTFIPSQYLHLTNQAGRAQTLTSPLSLQRSSTSAATSTITIPDSDINIQTPPTNMSWMPDPDEYTPNPPAGENNSSTGWDYSPATPSSQSQWSFQTLLWNQPRLVTQSTPEPPQQEQMEPSTATSVFTLSQTSLAGPSASQIQQPPPNSMATTGTTQLQDQQLQALRQKIRHTAACVVWAFECYRQYQNTHPSADTNPTLHADEAYRPLLESTQQWPTATEPATLTAMSVTDLMATLIPIFRDQMLNDD